MGLIEEDKNIKLSYLAEEFLETHNPDILLKALIRNVAFFAELLDKVLQSGEIHAKQLLDYLNNNYGVGWSSLAQILARVKWLWKLGYGEFSKNKFTININKKEEIRKILIEENEIEQETDSQLEDELKLISIKDIINEDEALDLIPKLTPERREAFKNVRKKFRNYKFSVVYILDQPIGTVVNIFERINTSGQVLKLVDLMVAKTWSNEFNLRDRLQNFLQELVGNNYGNITDVIILQCLSTNLQENCKRKDILDITREQIEEIWDKSIDSIKKTIDFLKTDLNISNSKILPYNSMIVPLTYFFYKLGNKDETSQQRKVLKEWFWKASISNRFDSAVEGRIAEDIKNVILPTLNSKEVIFDYTLPIITEEKIKKQKYSLGSAFAKTIMCMYAFKNPRHLENNKFVDFNSFSKFNAVEFHHIFPQNYLKIKQMENYDLKDSIANIAFVPAGANKSIRDKSPSDYIPKLKNVEIGSTLKTHFIPNYKESGLLDDDFNKFLQYRAKAILRNIKSIVGEFTPVEKGMYENEEKQIDLFEDKTRKLIDSILKKEDNKYWKNRLTDEFRERVEERITQWLNKHPSEKRENIDPIDFCLVMDYFRIIKMNWNIFERIFKSKTELEKQFLYINELRNAIKHSRKADLATRKHAEGSLVWFEQILKEIGK